VREVVRSFEAHAQQAGVELTLTGSAGPLWLDGVRPALRRAVSNLIDNALAHADGRVTVTLGRIRDSVTVQVDDDGSGLDPAHADELMRRFVRGTDDSGTGRRFGLGLALVREVVAAHRGRIDVDGEPGVGARFTLSFPAVS
jgi:signal transduction histidine kinase